MHSFKKFQNKIIHSLLFFCSNILAAELSIIPKTIPKADPWGVIHLPSANKVRPLTIWPELQQTLEKYLRNRGNPIAAIVLVDVNNGHILAMAQGRKPDRWKSQTHSALYESFPAASIFKMVTTIAALELADLNATSVLSLTSSCGKVHARGWWLRDRKARRYHRMNLSRAFANSCNSFYAKLAVEYLGMGALNFYAKKLGWHENIASDFKVPPSPFKPPDPSMSTIQTVGKYSAGFGLVGLSPVHAAWLNLIIARDGQAIPLRIFSDSDPLENYSSPFVENRMFSQKSSQELRTMMRRTVRSGTASSAFRSWKLRKVRRSAGGKTGTLNSHVPKGLATWFVGLMPYDQPQVVVSAIVVNSRRWVIKGSNLAAEGLRLWQKVKSQREQKILSKKTLSTPKNKS